MQRHILLIVYTMLSFHISISFSQQLSFSRISLKSGNEILRFTDIVQDHLGFTWLTSYSEGLFRYDGAEFINFQHNELSIHFKAT